VLQLFLSLKELAGARSLTLAIIYDKNAVRSQMSQT
jgi:hypothetical protein